MEKRVCMGAKIRCSFGTASSSLVVLPVNRIFENKMPVANIMDYIPMVNVPPFGVCTSVANPMVASATTAALGVLTPMPCVPQISSPWAPSNSTVLINKMPIINNSSKCFCIYGGSISIEDPGQESVKD